MTAYALPEDRDRCLAAGMDDYMTKPVSPDKLARALERHLPVAVPCAKEEVASPTPNVARVFDSSVLEWNLAGDKALIAMALDAYLDDAPKQVEALRSAIEHGDSTLVRRVAHALKGASATIGATAMREVAIQMEQAAEQGDLVRSEQLLRQMREGQRAFGSAVALMRTRDDADSNEHADTGSRAITGGELDESTYCRG